MTTITRTRKKTQSKADAALPESKIRSLSIRMYRQGLGDCFLLGLPSKDGKPFWMMIDCGVAVATKDRQKKFDALIADVRQVIGEGVSLDVLVITHDHFDHVSGFLHISDQFKAIGVKEVWFAWTEDPADPLARELAQERKERVKRLAGLAETLKAQGVEGTEWIADGIGNILGFFGLETFGAKHAEGDLPVSNAMAEIRSLDAKFRYLRPSDAPLEGAAIGIEGMRIYVLGPPQDRTLLRRTDARGVHFGKLAAGDEKERAIAEEQYKRLVNDEMAFFAAVNASDTVADLNPFEKGLGRSLDAYMARAQAKETPIREPDVFERFLRENYLGPAEDGSDQNWRRIDGAWYGAAAEFALQLDGATNNASLVLAIEDTATGKVFLFPGDAQVGNWQGWQRCRWTVDAREVTADDLLARTVFYKVGHHGSANATMRQDGLEKMTSPDLIAMIPVHRDTAKKMRWHDMPLDNLLIALNQATKVRTILSDEAYTGALNVKQKEYFQEVCIAL